jgi:hypothetical protein
MLLCLRTLAIKRWLNEISLDVNTAILGLLEDIKSFNRKLDD